jgi:hypothetical protein
MSYSLRKEVQVKIIEKKRMERAKERLLAKSSCIPFRNFRENSLDTWILTKEFLNAQPLESSTEYRLSDIVKLIGGSTRLDPLAVLAALHDEGYARKIYTEDREVIRV